MTLNVYWNNHLRQVYEFAEPRLFLPMVQASRAHVVMLAERGIVPTDRARRLLDGLGRLLGPMPTPTFDGSFEDVYYLLEQRLSTVMGIAPSDLDVQLGRSRNDLDAAVFRWTIREDLLMLGELILVEAKATATAAHDGADALIIGFTHRRPAQPTTVGHVLAGLVEARLSLLRELVSVYDEVNVSPLGSAAFAGTDLPIDPERVADLLGFAATFRSSYDAVAGAEHLFRPAALYARFGATTARFARTLLDWMTRGWIKTPGEFTQGSSIMPQKRNPVALEHLCSYAGAAAGDLASVVNNIGVAWFEDSNNATTDVQPYLQRAADRAIRTARLTGGLIAALHVQTLPTAADIVSSGATTTAAAEQLALQGVPWRGAHGIIHRLVENRSPTGWTAEAIAAAVRAEGFGPLPEGGPERILVAASDPSLVLRREQSGSPGVQEVKAYAAAAFSQLQDITEQIASRRGALADAAQRLDLAVSAVEALR